MSTNKAWFYNSAEINSSLKLFISSFIFIARIASWTGILFKTSTVECNESPELEWKLEHDSI